MKSPKRKDKLLEWSLSQVIRSYYLSDKLITMQNTRYEHLLINEGEA